MRYLESVGVSLVVENKSIQQDGYLFVMDSEVDVYTSVLPKEDINRDLLRRLHAYLQLQRDFIREKLELKSSIAYNLKLLKFIGFMVTLLITLKKHHKVIDIETLMVPMNIDRLHTERELPPVIPTQDSRWSPFISEGQLHSLSWSHRISEGKEDSKVTFRQFALLQRDFDGKCYEQM